MTVGTTEAIRQTTVSRDGTPIAWWRSGVGPDLLLVHGTTADHTRWETMLPLLEPHATVHAMDRRGRGGSGDSPAYSVAAEADDVAAVVEAIGRPVDVFGHSYGALVALEAAWAAAACAGWSSTSRRSAARSPRRRPGWSGVSPTAGGRT